MIASPGDDNLAFVITTESDLTGIKQAREQVAGIGTDAAVAATRLGVMSQQSNNASEKLTPISGRARTAANAFAQLGLAASGSTGSIQGAISSAGSFAYALASLSTSARLAASASGIGALVTIVGSLIPLLSRASDETERVSGGFRRAFGGDDANAGLFLRLARQRRAAAQAAVEGGPSNLSLFESDRQEAQNRKAALDDAVKDEQAAIEAVFAARRNAQRRAAEEAKQQREDEKRDRARTNDLYFDVTNERVLSGMRSSGNLEGADIQQASIDKLKRDLEINALKISEAEKADLRTRSAEATEARIVEIQRRYASRRIEVAKATIDAVVRTEGSVLQTLKRLALEPIINELEGIAAREAVKALASWPNPAAMAAHGLAAAAATAAAHEIAGWAGSGSKGGGGAASAGGGGAGTFEPRGSTEGQGSVTINLYSRNPYGTEQIQQIKYELDRAEVLKRQGVEIAPTNGLRAA